MPLDERSRSRAAKRAAARRRRILIREFRAGLLFPLLLFYFEIVFNLSTVRTLSGVKFLYIFLFSVFGGLIIHLFCTIFRNTNINRVIKAVFMFLLAVPFLVEYFVYLEFKIFYDLATVTAGAGHVIFGGFLGQTLKLIFSLRGLLRLLLYFAPFGLYVWRGHYNDKAMRLRLNGRIRVIMVLVIALLLNLIFINLSSIYRPVYGKEYSFQEAVSDFGLMSGLRKEIIRNLTGKSDEVTFENTGAPAVIPTTAPKAEEQGTGTQEPSGQDISDVSAVSGVSAESTSAEPTPTPTPSLAIRDTDFSQYDYNMLDIDFEAKAASASGTVKDLDNYVASQTPSHKNRYTGLFKGKNLIFISAEAFSGDIIDEKHTPTLYRMATKGINFTDFYQPASAGTTGGEYSNIFGLLPTSGGSSMKKTKTYNNYTTMGSQLNRLGYYGKMFHNNSYTYYDRDQTHVNLGYSDGYMGYGNGMEEYITKQWPESDLEMIDATVPMYIDKQPFNIYYMSVSGHSTYTYDSNAMSRKHWDEVQDLNYSDNVKAYVACNLELEAAMASLVRQLDEAGILDDTVIVISADHFPYGLDLDAALGKMPLLEELYGYKVENYLQRDHNRLIIWSGCLEKDDPIIVDEPTSSLDILPTLSNLFGTEFDSRLFPGRDVLSDAPALVFTLSYDWKTELGTFIAAGKTFTPVDDTVEIPEDYVATMRKIVANKINYCKGVLDTNYYNHVFG